MDEAWVVLIGAIVASVITLVGTLAATIVNVWFNHWSLIRIERLKRLHLLQERYWNWEQDSWRKWEESEYKTLEFKHLAEANKSRRQQAEREIDRLVGIKWVNIRDVLANETKVQREYTANYDDGDTDSADC